MKKFLAVYIGTATAREKSEWAKTTDPEKRRQMETAGMEAWGKWVAAHQAAIVDTGAPLGTTKRASSQGISDTTNQMAAYVIVQAESHQAAAEMFKDHPHFTLFPGDSVEIMECLPMPTN